MSFKIISEVSYFSGKQIQFKSFSQFNQCEMICSIYLPPKAQLEKVPVLYWLSGLTCTDENFVQKSGMQRYAAQHGVAVVAPDTSPRGKKIPKDPDNSWDFGLGASYYLSATEKPWVLNYQMYDYISSELPGLIGEKFPVLTNKASIFGHSMGGHGALVLALKNPKKYHSVSAFAPICSPINCPWGQKAFSYFLGEDKEKWKEFDTCELIKKAQEKRFELLIDQGANDSFLESQLKPQLLKKVCEENSYPLNLRWREGYDHSYAFIASFIEEHFKFHSSFLKKS